MSRLLLSLAGVGVLAVLLACGGAGGQKKESKQSGKASAVPYRVVAEHGLTKLIVIDKDHRNEKDLKALGEELRKDFGKERLVNVIVYDDDKAAGMWKDATQDQLKENDSAFYDKHMLGAYTRNANTGIHRFLIYLEGVAGPQIEVKYP